MTALDRGARGETGLRERKKQRTREAIVRAAMELFEQRGFEATTIHDIAAAADIAPRTFFGYFPSKEAVVFHDFDAAFDAFSERLASRAPGTTAFEAMRDWLLDWLADRNSPAQAFDLARHRLIEATPALAVYERGVLARFQAELARAIADDLGVPADSLRPHLAAAAAAAAIEAATHHGDLDDDPGCVHAASVLEEAIAFLRGGLDALRERSAGAE